MLIAAVTPLVVLTVSWIGTNERGDVDLSSFDPGRLIDDGDFYDGDAMSADQIQDFFDDHIGTCLNEACLSVLHATLPPRAPVVSPATGATICQGYDGGDLSAAQIIDRLQRACGISAKVLIVTLQKEQSLIDGAAAHAPTPERLAAAMGAHCPDTSPCDPGASGFAAQVVQGATDLVSYRASRYMRQPGAHWIAYSPDPACGGAEITIQNDATAALYNYTPYQPNSAALSAVWDHGDACSSYGNRNFALYWALWFR